MTSSVVPAGLTVLTSTQLGPTRAATVYGEAVDELSAAASELGVEVGPAALQDLFVHLTEPTGERS